MNPTNPGYFYFQPAGAAAPVAITTLYPNYVAPQSNGTITYLSGGSGATAFNNWGPIL
jgi:hypothetical protein